MQDLQPVAVLVVDAPNVIMQAKEAATSPGEEGPFLPTWIDYLSLKRWWLQRHPNVEVRFCVFTNLVEGENDSPKKGWIRHLRREGVEVFAQRQTTRTNMKSGERVKTDIDQEMRRYIRTFNREPFCLVEVVAVSHDGLCFGGVRRRPRQGLFWKLAENHVPVAYMGFGGLRNRPDPIEGVGYIDISEARGVLSLDFPRFDIPAQPPRIQPPPPLVTPPVEVAVEEEPLEARLRFGWIRRLFARRHRSIEP